jgi:hypothetical protein
MTPIHDASSGFDAEAIARVLDGRATAEERARLLAAADESPELLALLADSSAVLSEQTSGAGVTPIDLHRRRRFSRPTWVGIAALIVAAVTIPAVWRGRGDIPALPGNAIGGDAALVAARIGGTVSTARGGAEGDRALQSVVVGVRLVDYLTLAQRGDTAAATAAFEIAAALRSFAGGSAAATQFDNPGTTLSADAIQGVEQAVDLSRFRAAAWSERARLAAAASDTAALSAAEMRGAIRSIAANRSLPDAARSIARELLTAIESTPVDASIVASVASRLLVALPR